MLKAGPDTLFTHDMGELESSEFLGNTMFYKFVEGMSVALKQGGGTLSKPLQADKLFSLRVMSVRQSHWLSKNPGTLMYKPW